MILLVLALPGTTAAADLIISLDTSGSMQRSDPGNLRAEALELLPDIMRASDRIGLLGFDETASIRIPLTPAPELRGRMGRIISKIPARGRHTNLFSALELPLHILPGEGKGTGFIILLTDGKMDTGSPREDRLLEERILKELIPRMKRKKIRLFAVVLSGEPDSSVFPERITSASGGGTFRISNSREIHMALSQIFSEISSPDRLPVRTRKFSVDPTVKELNIIATRAHLDTPIRLELPSGEVLTWKDHPVPVRWHRASLYEFIHIREPMTGVWKILYSSGRDERVFILADLTLKVWGLDSSPRPGRRIEIYGVLSENGKRFTKVPLILEDVKFTGFITGPDGEDRPLIFSPPEPPPDGVYSASFLPSSAGMYRITVRATGKTFERERVLAIQIPPEEAPLYAEPLRESSSTPPHPTRSEEGKGEEQELPPARKVTKEPPQEPPPPEVPGKGEPGPPPPTQMVAEPVDWGWAFLRFGLINLAGGLLVGGAFLIRKKRRSPGNAQD